MTRRTAGGACPGLAVAAGARVVRVALRTTTGEPKHLGSDAPVRDIDTPEELRRWRAERSGE